MAKKTRPTPPVQINVVAEGTVLEGTLYVKEDVRVSGRIIGTVTAQKRVIVALEGVIDGEMAAATADVFGRVQGDLDVAEHLVLRSGSHVAGRLKTEQLTVEKGAVFNGTCQMGNVAATPQAGTTDKAEMPTPWQAKNVDPPALPDWVDVLGDQQEPTGEKAALPGTSHGIRIDHPKADENRPDPATAEPRPHA